MMVNRKTIYKMIFSFEHLINAIEIDGSLIHSEECNCEICRAIRSAMHTLKRLEREVESMTWFNDPHELGLVLSYVLSDCTDTDECRRVVEEICDKPWKWADEYERAKEQQTVQAEQA